MLKLDKRSELESARRMAFDVLARMESGPEEREEAPEEGQRGCPVHFQHVSPGREFDDLILREVFHGILTHACADGETRCLWCGAPADPGSARCAGVPPFSTSFPAAWLVVERLGFFVIESGADGVWRAMCAADERRPEGRGRTAAEAICRAAMMVVAPA